MRYQRYVNKYKKSFEFSNMQELVLNAAKTHGEADALRYLEGNEIKSKSYIQLKQDVIALSNYFNLNNINKKRIVMLGEFSYQWLSVFLALLSSGNMAVLVNKDLCEEEICDQYKLSESHGVVFSDNTQKKFGLILEKLGKLQFSSSFSELINAIDINREIICPNRFTYEIANDLPAAIIFTSGTTGVSKAAVLTHKNLAYDAIGGCMLSYLNHKDILLFILPTFHAFGLCVSILSVYCGMVICVGKGIRYLPKDLKSFQPTVLVAVPAIAKGIYQQIWSEIRRKDKDKLIKILIKITNLFPIYKRQLRRYLFKDIYIPLGGNLQMFISGGAPISKDLIDNYEDIGLHMLNGYGITECGPIVSVNMQQCNKSGSVGPVLPFAQVRIVNDEILVKGDIVSPGYYNNAELTKESFRDGWYATGDIGYIDKKGFLYVTGRKKNLIILENGENVSPEEIETKLMMSNYIKDIIVCESVVNNNQFLKAIVYPDYSNNLDRDLIINNIIEEIKNLNDKSPSHKKLYLVDIALEELSKTAIGKIKKEQNVTAITYYIPGGN